MYDTSKRCILRRSNPIYWIGWIIEIYSIYFITLSIINIKKMKNYFVELFDIEFFTIRVLIVSIVCSRDYLFVSRLSLIIIFNVWMEKVLLSHVLIYWISLTLPISMWIWFLTNNVFNDFICSSLYLNSHLIFLYFWTWS
jgi:hypothetical protein